MESTVQMRFTNAIPFQVTDWNSAPEKIFKGETGFASWKIVTIGDLRIRLVQYSENYLADHWCSLGHIVYCLEGEFVSELSDGRSFTLSAGMSYQVSDDASSHRSVSEHGATLLIVDGGFLKRNKTVAINPWRM
jgi:hypothetical protein